VLLSGCSLGVGSGGTSCQGLFAHVRYEEDNSENNAESADNNVANGEEVVLPAKHVSCRENEIFLSLEVFDVVVVFNLNSVLSLLEDIACDLNLTVEFPEVGQTSGPHPHNKVLIFYVSPLDILPLAESRLVLRHFQLVFEFVLNIRLPRNTCLVELHQFVRAIVQAVGVIEQALCDESAWDGDFLADERNTTDGFCMSCVLQLRIFIDRVARRLHLVNGPGLTHELTVVA